MDVVTYALAKKLTEFPMENLVQNGDFSDGVTYWRFYDATAYQVTDEGIHLTHKGSGNDVGLWQDINSGRVGDKIYARYDYKGQFDGKFRTVITDFGSFATNQKIVYGLDIVYPNFYDTMQTNKTIFTLDRNNFRIGTFSSYITTANYILNNFILINLTSVFGAGCEPTVEEMDALLSYFPESWFDGKANLPGKWVIKYLLNQVRDLKTAVAGLGGTL